MKGLSVGQQAEVTRTFSAEDVVQYRALTGDAGMGFGGPAGPESVPGPLLAGMISFLLGTQLPGRGTNWLKQQLSFPQPAQVGEPVTAVVTITRLRPEKQLVNLRSICANAAGDLLCEGESLVLVQDLEM